MTAPDRAIELPSLPLAFHRTGAAGEHRVDGASLAITAPARTDWFVDPTSGAAVRNAPALLAAVPAGDFTLAARVTAAARSRFDAGCLFLYADDNNWAKLCLEQSPGGSLMIVSVVTRGRSDDCNSEPVAGRSAWLRVARIDESYAFHASADGRRWRFVRLFAFAREEPRLGFEAQSPVGEGCVATFEEISFDARRLTDLRDGS